MNTIDVGLLFDQGAQDYDRTRRQYIPCFDDFYGTALQFYPADSAQPMHVLDLGAAQGCSPAWRGPCCRMRASRCATFQTYSSRRRAGVLQMMRRWYYLIADYVDGALAGEYDVIMSALSIHHTPHGKLPGVFPRCMAP